MNGQKLLFKGFKLVDALGNIISPTKKENNLQKSKFPKTVEVTKKENGMFKIRILKPMTVPLNEKIFCIGIPSNILVSSKIVLAENSRGGLRYFVAAVPEQLRFSCNIGDEMMPYSPYGPINPKTGHSDTIVIMYPEFIETRYTEEFFPYQNKYYVLYDTEMAGRVPLEKHGIEIEFLE
jgi:hypothetical protein